MATETFLDLAYERTKSTKRPLRPKLLKLTDVATPHRSRKKTKVKSKDRSTTVRERIYDDPAYTEDISHLANPLRRSSISGKSSGDYKLSSEPIASSSSLGKRSQLTKDFLKYAVNKPLKTNTNNSNSNNSNNSVAVNMEYDFDSSSSDNEPQEPIKDGSITRRVLSLERSLAAASEKNEKKTSSGQKRSSKQKRNLSLDNSRKGGQSKSSYELSESRNRKERNNRKQYLEAEMALGEQQQDDVYSVRSSAQNSAATMPVESSTKLPIGRRFLRGEIGIKSFNYYLLKEGLKSSKKLDKQRSTGDAATGGNNNSNTKSSNVKKLHTRSEENIYEEIFFKELPAKQDNTLTTATTAAVEAATVVAAVQSDDEIQNQQQQHHQQCLPDAGVYADCELCMQQCSKENCKYCLVQDEPATVVQQQQQQQHHSEQPKAATALPAAHILEFQSYNPNNPGVYKIETTPVAITGEYNPILQFQQSSAATTSTSATTTPSEQQQHMQQQLHHRQQQQLYGGYYQQQAHHKAYQQQQQQQHQQQQQQHNVASHPLTNHYAVGGSLLLAQVTPRRPQQQQQQQQHPQQQQHAQQQQGYIVSYQNGAGGAASVQRMNTKSSSSSDSLPYHKYNTMARLEANALYAAPATGDIYYAIGGMSGQPLHPLMYAASRPIGGSQILVDHFETPQMYKSDSRASILSEFSLRSSDNSQRFSHRYPHRSSMFSSHSNAHQRRYFGSTESCRIPYDCRRCSLDGVMGAGSNVAGGATPGDKCSYSDNCRYECRNCDCSSSYFSSDFDDIYGSMARGGSSGIPRKTAAGTLPSSGPAEPADYEQAAAPLMPTTPQQQQPPQMDLKQNKYAMDFFKHVNDVKRSIYQSEMQRNNSLESTRRIHRSSNSNNSNNNPKSSPKRAVSQPQEPTLVITTLPLSKGRSASATKPTPAPRTSLQNPQSQPPEEATPTPSKRKPQPTERREYPSLDRLVASTTGAIPKRQSRAEEEPKSSGKIKSKHKETEPRERRDRSAPAGDSTSGVTLNISSKRHHRSNSGKSHAGSGNPVPITRRKDIPAPPPPSPATYSDLQELKANMEGLQDDTKSRSLESETSETPTTIEQKAARSQAQAQAALAAHSALVETKLVPKLPPESAEVASAAEVSVKSSATTTTAAATTMAPKSATEAEDDDVFYDARSEDSAAGLSVISTPREALEALEGSAAISQPTLNKDVCVAQAKRELSGILTQAAATTLTKDTNEQQQQQQQQQQLSKAIVENAMPTDAAASLLAANVCATGSQEPTNDEPVDKTKNEAATTAIAAADSTTTTAIAALATIEAATKVAATTALPLATNAACNMKSLATCCVSEAGECVQSDEATVKTNGELTSKTKRNNGNVAATCMEGQANSLLPTNVAISNSNNSNTSNTSNTSSSSNTNTNTNSNNNNNNNDSSNSIVNDNDSTTIGATLELEFSCKSEHTDSATLVANSEPATTVLTRPDYTCLDSSEAQSDDSHLTRDSVTRESQNDELSSSTLDKLDLSTLPLPALPPKRRRTRSRASPSKHHHQQQQLQQQQLQQQQQQFSEHVDGGDKSVAASAQQYRKQKRDSLQDSLIKAELLSDNQQQQQHQQPSQPSQPPQAPQQHLSAFQQYVAKRRESLEASTRNFNEKLEARRMLYHMGGNGGGAGAASGVPAATDGSVPTYLFGEHFYGVPTAMRKSTSPAGNNKEEIFLNKSGWVQVSSKLHSNSENKRRLNYAHQNGDASAMLDKHGRSAIRVIQMDQMRRPEMGRQSFVHQPASMCERESKFVGSKVEELIQRNEARLSGMSSRDPALRPGYRILDPQLASILNERPGFLPVKSPNDLESPPPITPILSPPPAFQDNSSNSSRPPRHPERRKVTRQSHTLVQQPRALHPPPTINTQQQHHQQQQQQLQLQQQQQQLQQHQINPKGMVFSRSFEYDTRRPAPTNNYVETFSRSFDGNLSERPTPMPSLAVQRERSLNFSTLTGNSPNYLTKREGPVTGSAGGSNRSLRSRDNSPKYLQPQTTAYLNASVKEAPPAYSVASNNLTSKYSPRSRHDRTFERSKSHNVIGRSRKSQFSRMGNSGPAAPPPVALGMSRFRSLDTTINNRLNSCDSGARSDLSNDELDNEDGSSTEFLSATNYQFPNVSGASVSISPFKTQRQRSLTPDRNDSHSSSSSLRKQRSLTPESRSLTPEERRKKGSQVSLMSSRQNSSSRSNTLERRQRHEDKTPPTISRSSSSSSYSGGESHEPLNGSPSTAGTSAGGASGAGSSNYRRAVGRSAAKQQAEQEHLIRRSRSLQLSERSPNRGHKSVVCVGGASPQQQQQQQQQATVHYQQSNAGIFPSSMRASKMLPSSNGASGNSTRLRQSDVDKACSFDFDYNNYNRGGGNNVSSAPRSAHTSGSGGDSGSNQNLRLDFDKSRSFDEDYREALLNNNGGSSGGSSVRFLQPGGETVAVVATSSGRLRQSNSPVGATGHERNTTRSPQSSGSSSNNLHLPSRRTSSPQSYGTRLCDHELTYEMLRKSPIMNFRRGDSDYELPVQLRNRETINSGGNSELNFMSNETRIYEHPTTVMKPPRSSSREDHLYRQTTAPPRGSSPVATTGTNKKCRKSLNSCDYWPRCDACSSTLQHSASSPGVQQSLFAINRQNSMPAVVQEAQQPTHVSTVAVNVNVIKLDTCEAIASAAPAPASAPAAPSKCATPQWTLLCSGGVHAAADSVPQKTSQLATTSKDRRQPTAVIRPRVIPLAASSLVLLGDCNLVTKAAERTEISTSSKNNLATVNASEPTNQQCQQPAATGNKRDLVAILTEANSNGDNRKRQRSHSLPERSPTTSSTTTAKTTRASEQLLTTQNIMGLSKIGKDDVNVIGIRCNGYAECLSQQMRAISSPTLSETPAKSQDEVKPTTATSNEADVLVATSGGSNTNSSSSSSLGVLQKFKRTLHNLNNRNQLQITPMPGAAVVNVDGKSSPTTPTVSITAPTTTTTIEPETGGDSSSAKYRFGPLIWRSSKERRKTKFNRRDKCNSGDSGIQIELEQDEQYVRALSGNGQPSGGVIARTSTPNTAEAKARTIRRTHSAKATSILEQVATKPPIHKQLDLGSACSIEREAPESLPTRSLSQPNGLETYGIRRTDIEDSDSDSVASHEEANSYYPIYAEVLYNFTAAGPQELGLERGTLIEILRKEVGPWWFGRIKKEDTSLVKELYDPELGWFPKDFVRIIHSPETDAFFYLQKSTARQEEEEEEEPISQSAAVDVVVDADTEDNQMPVPVVDLNSSSEEANNTMTMDQSNITTIVIESPPTSLTPSARITVPLDNCDILRRSAVRELLETEINYVKLLASICDGYLPAMSKRIDIFSPNSIRLIFSNITAIYKFQRKFLEALRKGIEQNQLSKVFLKMNKGFLCYSTYCNAYPRALIELESYDRIKDARTILENCRESENLAELPLSAHLLAPVQRICRYPLHLNEIIKTALSSTSSTDEVDGQTEPLDYEQHDVFQLDVPDTHDIVNLALEKMRGITEAVNEGKRHSETIARHQASFQNFKGPPLHLHSTRFFLQVDATRQKQNLWNTSCTLFLFDNQLIYCKRDIIKRSQFIYKGRIFLDRCRVVNVRDGKMFGHTIKNSLRIYCESRDKWYDFSFRSANRKHRFLNTLALERQFGGKALYVSEMAGFEYNYDERPGDYSDQSDYELPDCEHALGGTSASGDSSVPDSPAKSPYRSCDTLPKKSQSRDGIANASNGSAQGLTTSTGSLGRRRIGNWFRKPKSTNCTPSQSPTHKPGFDADVTLTAARVAAIELVEAAAAQQEMDSSFA